MTRDEAADVVASAMRGITMLSIGTRQGYSSLSKVSIEVELAAADAVKMYQAVECLRDQF